MTLEEFQALVESHDFAIGDPPAWHAWWRDGCRERGGLLRTCLQIGCSFEALKPVLAWCTKHKRLCRRMVELMPDPIRLIPKEKS